MRNPNNKGSGSTYQVSLQHAMEAAAELRALMAADIVDHEDPRRPSLEALAQALEEADRIEICG